MRRRRRPEGDSNWAASTPLSADNCAAAAVVVVSNTRRESMGLSGQAESCRE
jgi:hypothetical protein